MTALAIILTLFFFGAAVAILIYGVNKAMPKKESEEEALRRRIAQNYDQDDKHFFL